MKISSKGRYALQIMLDLAQCPPNVYTPIKEIAARQQLSLKYLEQIMNMLSKAGLLHSIRGPQGGYMLTRKPSEYIIGDILRATEGNLAPVDCIEITDKSCPKLDSCPMALFWNGLHEAVLNYIDSITLADLIEKSRNLGPSFCEGGGQNRE
ncbi:MAG: Rrf2 family transcriptional regulator [Clostridiales bacterium]|jgi:Rrf2 family protein|nr:Rrf2 family transcriptional regulator [Clostridiales bacterium]HOA33939.1 Rrf2 family transcriptional regulator [Clostridiales bacterium]HOL78940.1 Rrf2 family transcriptional regulator [Clostridiales bacterium]HPP68540.1 Rrf2 family transcriptional regulator [Clostridiales bacterium]HPU67184.1 Rrf2 family transcriptional regulator [Clostridiales bacterium]